jgi:hypothetical protein
LLTAISSPSKPPVRTSWDSGGRYRARIEVLVGWKKEYLWDLIFSFELDVGGVTTDHIDLAVVCADVDVHLVVIMIFNFNYLHKGNHALNWFELSWSQIIKIW